MRRWIVAAGTVVVGLTTTSTALARWVENNPGVCSVGPPPACVSGHWHWEPDLAMGQGWSMGRLIWHQGENSRFVSNDVEYKTVKVGDATGHGIGNTFLWSFMQEKVTYTPGFHAARLGSDAATTWTFGPDMIAMWTVQDRPGMIVHAGGIGSFTYTHMKFAPSDFIDRTTVSSRTLVGGAVADILITRDRWKLYGSGLATFSVSGGEGQDSTPRVNVANADGGGVYKFNDRVAGFGTLSLVSIGRSDMAQLVAGGVSYLLMGDLSLDSGIRKSFGYANTSDWKFFVTVGHFYGPPIKRRGPQPQPWQEPTPTNPPPVVPTQPGAPGPRPAVPAGPELIPAPQPAAPVPPPSVPEPGEAPPDCKSDDDCAGDSVCEAGHCTTPI